MRISWNEEQLLVLGTFDTEVNFASDLSDDDLSELYDIAPEYLAFGTDGTPQKDCLVVESIITALAQQMEPRGLLG